MSGPFQKAIDEIAIRSGINGGPTIQDLLTAMIAGHDEAEATAEHLRLQTEQKAEKLAEELRVQHQQSLDAIDANRRVLEAHFLEAQIRDRRLDVVEGCIAESQRTCKERVERLIREEHAERHGEHLISDHAPERLEAPSGEDAFRARLVWFFAQTTGKVVLVFLGLAAGVLINLLVYGRP